MPQQVVFGTTLFALLPPAFVSSFTHWRAGHIVLRCVPPMILGAAVGANIGALISLHLNETNQQRTLAIMLLILAANSLR